MAEPTPKIPPVNLWKDSGKCLPGPNELQKMYFIDRVDPSKRPHLHTQDVLLSIGGQGSGKTYGGVARVIDQCLRWPKLSVYIGAYDFQVLKRNVWAPFEEILIPSGDKKKGKHPALIKAFSDPSPVAKFINGSTANCINLKNNLKQNIGFTADLLVIDEVHLLPDEDALNLLIGRARGSASEIRQVILCTNPEKTKQGWMNHTFDLKQFDGVDTSEHPVEKLVGPKCQCQVCTKCRFAFKKDYKWVQEGNEMVCPNCKSTKDFYTWQGKRYWCPGDQQYWRVIKSESTHNPHLPDDYFQGMENMYDPVLFNIMVKGQLNSDLREDYVYKEYSDQADGNLLDENIELDFGKDLLWGLDFNLRPQCSTISQIEQSETGESFLVCKDEIVMYGPTFDVTVGGATVVDVANEFVRRYRDWANTGVRVKVYGDPHGYGNVTSRELTRYQQIYNILSANGFTVETIADNKNIPLKERIDNVNHMLRTRKLVVNPRCEHVAKSLAELQWKDNVDKDTLNNQGDHNARKSNKRTQVYCMTHPTDGLGYLIYKEFNLLKNLEGGRSLTIVGQSRVTESPEGVVTTEDLSKTPTEKVDLNAEMVRERNEQKNREFIEEQNRLHAQIQADLDAIMNRSMNDLMGGFVF